MMLPPMEIATEQGWALVDLCAIELGILPENRRKWRERNRVPHRWRLPLLQQFARHGRLVGLDFFDNLSPGSGTEADSDDDAGPAESGSAAAE